MKTSYLSLECRGFIMSRVGRPLGQSDFLEADEVKKILELPKRNTRQGLRDYAILLVLSNTPMRKGELKNLKVGNLVQSSPCAIEYALLKKRGAKQKVRRVRLPIPDSVFAALQRYLKSEYKNEKLTADLPLFRTLAKHGNCTKQALTAKAVDCLVMKYTRLAGIKKRITPHSFRATYLTLRLDKGVSPSTLKELAVHESLSSTEKYLRTNMKRIQEGALAIKFE